MLLDRDIDKYLLSEKSDIATALNLLNANKLQIVFVVSDERLLLGSFTDGDFRRWILKQSTIDINEPVVRCMNPDVFFATEENESQIEQRLSEKYKYVPVVDKHRRIVSIAYRKKQAISIDKHTISKSSPCFVIAEIGNNHNGDISLAKKLVSEAVAAGADCVKFQMRHLPSLYVNGASANNASEDLGSQYILDQLCRFQLNDSEFEELFQFCKEQHITCLCTPFDEISADRIEKLGLQGFKVASADLTNHSLLTHLARKGLPIILSTGMSNDEEIKMAVELLKSEGAQFVLLHCNSTYPAPFKDIQLPYLVTLAKMNAGLVGYSGHERGIHVAVAAVALGAKVIEKHFTLDRNMEGNDHKVSLLPSEFAELVQAIRQVESAMGISGNRVISQGEMINRENLAKSIVACKDIKKGETIDEDKLSIKSPGKGLAPYYLPQLIGTISKRDIVKGEFLFKSDLVGSVQNLPKHYSFDSAFGIPVRYHDSYLSQKSNFSILEYHLSYQDLNIQPSDYISIDPELGLVVHAPELFAGDHTLDLASDDKQYRQHSVNNLNRVLDIARELKQFYPKTTTVPVVVNVGGFSQHDFLSTREKEFKYKLVAQSLSLLNLKDIDLLIQTMPPYPWHFGGQRFHNLFVHPNEIADFCSKHCVNVCLDISHSFLAANKFGYSLSRFFHELGPVIKHVHIADGTGVDDEGLGIGLGEIDFVEVFELMRSHCKSATWIPEIWQGHKNHGEGFWVALEKLEEQANTARASNQHIKS